ncbi:sigma-70 family RNA polymerase sigma factor [Motilibacter aurantiacus]|uniref:sigma-70 family RNA polymerase sigma factor n=1 Tax=Motilibacter aurantiacus TaxID=2714955 RepID=UPI00140AF655|nr:sigma-70 family RNA polymerase sigma factor [Motilibacter aurantiacus]NHC44296.1 sigma-70 family RNA polymerase sigma factor [Motilibacter aurantiacus]
MPRDGEESGDLGALLLAARDDEAAAAAFVRALQPSVWRFVASLLGPRTPEHDIAEVVQETFVRTLTGRSRWRGDASATTWVLAIARRCVADHLSGLTRRRAREGVLDESLHDVPTADLTSSVELADLIARLGDDRREAFVLTQALGLSYAEAAEVCGVPIGTIRSRVARARADLVEAYAPTEDTVVEAPRRRMMRRR